jgi:PAS domain S-box-containing protein
MKEMSLTLEEFPGLLSGKFNNNLTHSILDIIEAFICIFDIDNLKIIWTNRYITRRLGYSAKELTNMTSDEILMLFPPCFQEHIIESLRHYDDNHNRERQTVLQIKTKDDNCIWILASSTSYENNTDGTFHYILAFATEFDITQLNSELNRMSEMSVLLPQEEMSNLLSDRQKNILKLIANGNTDREISVNLNISIHTAKTHRKRIIHKLCLKNSPTLIKYAIENGLG